MESEDKEVDVQEVLKQRGEVHGDFVTHAEISQKLKYTVHAVPKWDSMDDYKTEALDMILHKIARVMNGDDNYQDHWVDIAGYATLVANQLGMEQK